MGVKAEILYSPKGPDWLTPSQFRAAALASGIIVGLIAGLAVIEPTTEPQQPAGATGNIPTVPKSK